MDKCVAVAGNCAQVARNGARPHIRGQRSEPPLTSRSGPAPGRRKALRIIGRLDVKSISHPDTRPQVANVEPCSDSLLRPRAGWACLMSGVLSLSAEMNVC